MLPYAVYFAALQRRDEELANFSKKLESENVLGDYKVPRVSSEKGKMCL